MTDKRYKKWKVYELHFHTDEEFVYYGTTNTSIRDRLYRHKKRPVNAKLYQLLSSGAVCVDSIISTHRLRERAVAAERKIVKQKLKEQHITGIQVLNRGVPGREGHRLNNAPKLPSIGALEQQNEERRLRDSRSSRARIYKYKKRNNGRQESGSAWCSWCKSHYPVKCFASDRSRYNGLDSRCRVCQAEARKYMYEFVKQGKTRSEGWAEARRVRTKLAAKQRA